MKKWIKSTAIKAIKTMAQTAVAMLTVGQAVTDVNWVSVISISVTSGIIAILTNIANLEAGDNLAEVYTTNRKSGDDEEA